MEKALAVVDLNFPHRWQAEILAVRPLILPRRHFVYPREASGRGGARGAGGAGAAGGDAQPFLATCALGFRDPAVPTGLWACPRAEELCAVSGGYAYLIDTSAPERFSMIAFRPVLEVRAVAALGLLLFVGHHGMLAWGAEGLAWTGEPEKLLR